MSWHWHHDWFGTSGGYYPDTNYLELSFNYQKVYLTLAVMAPIIGENYVTWNSKFWRDNHILGDVRINGTTRPRRVFEFGHRSLRELKDCEERARSEYGKSVGG